MYKRQITNRSTQSRLYGLLRTTDIFIFVADLTNQAVENTNESFSELKEWGFKLIEKNSDLQERDFFTMKPTIIACNKADIPGALDNYEMMENAFGQSFPLVLTSAEEEVGIEELGIEIFNSLNGASSCNQIRKKRNSRNKKRQGTHSRSLPEH